MMRLLSKLIFRITGWKVEGEFPPGRYVVVGAPHTSNWDFLYGLAALYILQGNVKYLIKKEWFFWPLGSFFRFTGGIPVDRSRSTGFTEELKEQLYKYEDMKLVFPAEGTRSSVERWKTGFYHTAKNAELPIIMAYLDYGRKVAGVDEPFTPTDQEKDFARMEEFFKNITPCIPENYNTKIY